MRGDLNLPFLSFPFRMKPYFSIMTFFYSFRYMCHACDGKHHYIPLNYRLGIIHIKLYVGFTQNTAYCCFLCCRWGTPQGVHSTLPLAGSPSSMFRVSAACWHNRSHTRCWSGWAAPVANHSRASLRTSTITTSFRYLILLLHGVRGLNSNTY